MLLLFGNRKEKSLYFFFPNSGSMIKLLYYYNQAETGNPYMTVVKKITQIWFQRLHFFLSHDKVKFLSILNTKNAFIFSKSFIQYKCKLICTKQLSAGFYKNLWFHPKKQRTVAKRVPRLL